MAADPNLSLYAKEAADLPSLRGDLEEIVTLKPDKVLMAQNQNSIVRHWLRHRGIDLFMLRQPRNIEELQAQLKDAGAELQSQEKVESIIHRQNETLKNSRFPFKPRVGIYYPHGFSEGAGTLFNDIILRLGGVNIAEQVKGSVYLSLEDIIALKPDVLFMPKREYNRLAMHPAFATQNISITTLPGSIITCPHLGLEPFVLAIKEAIEAWSRKNA